MKKIITEIILLVIAGVVGFFSYLTYNISCESIENQKEIINNQEVISSSVKELDTVIRDYISEPVMEVTEEQYEQILNSIK